MAAVMRAVAALLVAVTAAGPASAWGEFGHRTTAAIAMENIAPRTRAELAALWRHAPLLGTPECPLADLEDASYWPDCLRGNAPRWAYTFPWHYRTAPICEPFNPRANCASGNCVTAQIERNFRLLADRSLPGNIRLEALAFMVHFAGDVHMPLHSGDREDRGGNDRRVTYGIIPGLNLHWAWDGPIAERAITSARPALTRRFTGEERRALGGGRPDDWGRESWQTARDFVYPEAFGRPPCEDELPQETALSQETIERALPVAERRITQAGLRIAELLDAALSAPAAAR
ncbi:S1/P1 nuclease [Qipengyuania thermophila]|uniref:S1/P1 nuclease n=1 Tax=Qipengyuania thermophila TaxID=2509361 RepID=UPI001F31DB29|nr:S1/P1 nuclease [Qipengyuania thermophila]